MGQTLELPPADFQPPEPPERPQQEASPRRRRRIVALSAAALVAGGVGTPLLLFHGGGADEKVSAPAPARPRASATAAKTAPHATATARPSAQHPVPYPSSSPKPPEYDKTAVVQCLGLRATQTSPGTLVLTPMLEKNGHPNPNQFVTVVDRTQTSATSAPIQDTLVAKGFGASIEVTHVNTNVSAQVGRDLLLVSVFAYDGRMPSDPADFSLLKPSGAGTGRTGDGCGEGVITLLDGGVLMNPPGP